MMASLTAKGINMKRITGIAIVTFCLIGCTYVGAKNGNINVTYDVKVQNSSERDAELCDTGSRLKSEGASAEAVSELMQFARMSDEEKSVVTTCYKGNK